MYNPFVITNTVSDKLKSFIDSDKPLDIEIGFAKGKFILGKANLYKDVNFLGFEIRKKWVTLVTQQIEEKNIENLYVEMNYADLVIPIKIPNGRVRNIYILFPDPWWKRKHKGRRIIQQGLIDIFYNSLQMGGKIYIRTDVEEYANTMKDVFSHIDLFKSVEHDIINDSIITNREVRCKKEGLNIHYLAYEKIK